MSQGHYNRQGRVSGGNRPARFNVPNPRLSPADIELLRQEAIVRRQFGEDGVQLFWQKVSSPERNVAVIGDDRDKQ